ncbi:MAG: hypothetical protein R6X23_02465 [Acidimicrobiia bacterium]
MHGTGTWRCDFVAPGIGSVVLGGFVQLEIPAPPAAARYWAYLVGPDLGIVAVRDHDVPRPRPGALTVRADGLWAELVCEIPDVHWTIGLEAFGVRLDGPADALQGEIGERIAVGLDIEWDDGAVLGDVLIGTDRIELDGTGPFVAAGPSTWSTTAGLEAAVDAVGLPVALSVATGRGRAEVDVLAVVPVPLGDGPGSPLLFRVLGAWRDDDGASVRGWLDIVSSREARGRLDSRR